MSRHPSREQGAVVGIALAAEFHGTRRIAARTSDDRSGSSTRGRDQRRRCRRERRPVLDTHQMVDSGGKRRRRLSRSRRDGAAPVGQRAGLAGCSSRDVDGWSADGNGRESRALRALLDRPAVRCRDVDARSPVAPDTFHRADFAPRDGPRSVSRSFMSFRAQRGIAIVPKEGCHSEAQRGIAIVPNRDASTGEDRDSSTTPLARLRSE